MKSRAAFSLVEVAIALGIFSFCLIGLFGLLPVAMNSNRVSVEENGALNAMARLIASLQALPAGPTAEGGNWSVEGLQVPNRGDAASMQTLYYTEKSAGQFSTTPRPDATYRITVRTTPASASAGGTAYGATSVYLRATWPAQADPTSPTVSSVDSFTALER